MNPFLKQPSARQRTPLRAESPSPKTGDSGIATIRLYEPLDSWGGNWGVSAKEFVAVLDELPADTTEIRLLINSPGGEVWEGLAVLNALRAHPAKVVAIVEGIAASAASFIAAGVDELHVMKNAELFVHNAWGLSVGNASDMQKMAADLSHEDRNLASIYADKAGGSVEEWLAAMAAETWYSAEEAVVAGLADQVADPHKGGGAAEAKNRFDLSIFAHTGRAEAPAPQTPAASASGSTHKERSTPVPFTDEHLTTLRTTLGLAADASEDKIVATVAEVMTEFVKEPEAPTANVPAGMKLVDEATLSQLTADAKAGRIAHDKQQDEQREQMVTAALAAGQIGVAAKDFWLNKLKVEGEIGEQQLASIPKGLIPVAEVGHDTQPAAKDDLGWFDTVSTTPQEG